MQLVPKKRLDPLCNDDLDFGVVEQENATAIDGTMTIILQAGHDPVMIGPDSMIVVVGLLIIASPLPH